MGHRSRPLSVVDQVFTECRLLIQSSARLLGKGPVQRGCVWHEIRRTFPCPAGPPRLTISAVQVESHEHRAARPHPRLLDVVGLLRGLASRVLAVVRRDRGRLIPARHHPARRAQAPGSDAESTGGRWTTGPPGWSGSAIGATHGAGAAGSSSRDQRGRDPARRRCDYPVRYPALAAPPGSPRAAHQAGCPRTAPRRAGSGRRLDDSLQRKVAGSVCRVGDPTRQVGRQTGPGAARPICTSVRGPAPTSHARPGRGGSGGVPGQQFAQQVAVGVGTRRQQQPDPAAPDDRGPVAVARAQPVGPPGRDDEHARPALGDQRGQGSRGVVHPIRLVDHDQRRPSGSEIGDGSHDRVEARWRPRPPVDCVDRPVRVGLTPGRGDPEQRGRPAAAGWPGDEHVLPIRHEQARRRQRREVDAHD